MTQDSKHLVVQLVFRLGLYCAWLAFVTFLTTISCIALFHGMLQIEQVRSSVAHSEIWRNVIVYSIGIIWIVLQMFFAFLLPIMIFKRRARMKQ